MFRIPYPMPYYARGLDGRIDDAKAGWKGRGLWMTYSSYLPRFTENRSGTVNHMQIRPNPLANYGLRRVTASNKAPGRTRDKLQSLRDSSTSPSAVLRHRRLDLHTHDRV